MRSSKRSIGTWVTAGSLIIVLTLFVVFGPPTTTAKPPVQQPDISEDFTLADWPMSKTAAFGRVVYEESCIGCHGDNGMGDGPAASFLDPLPRNFQNANFKFRTTPYGKLPRIPDLVRTITRGLPGSSMPSFELMPEVKRKAVAVYIQHVSTFRKGRDEVVRHMKKTGQTLEEVLDADLGDIKRKVWKKRVSSLQPIAVPPSPKVTTKLLALGKKRYLDECNRCHGDTGRGDGISSYTLRDWKDEPIVARDFTTGVFRAGSKPADIFTRMRTGLTGTPMPSIPGSDEEIWALAHFVLSLKDPQAYVNRVHTGRGLPGGRDDN